MSDSGYDVQIPYSQEAEEALLGAVLLSPMVIDRVYDLVDAEDFYILRHRYVWETYLRLQAEKQPIDYITVTQSLKDCGQLGEIGGPAYLIHLTGRVDTTSNAPVYAALIRSRATRRRLMIAADHIKGLALNNELTVDEALGEAGAKLDGVTSYSKSTLYSIRDAVNIVMDDVDARRENPNALPGLSTGYPNLDALTDGIQDGDYTIIAGRTSIGKTQFALNLFYNVAKALQAKNDPRAVLYVSMEMTVEQLTARLLAYETDIKSRVIRRGFMDDINYKRFVKGGGDLAQLPILLDFRSGVTPAYLFSLCRRIQRERGLAFVVVDGLWLMQDDEDWGANERLKFKAVSGKLKNGFHDMRLPGVVLHQINRSTENGEDKRPTLAGLTETDAIAQDADMVMLLYREGYYNPNLAAPDKYELEINVAKARNGGDTGNESLFLDPVTGRLKQGVKIDLSQL